MVEVEEVDLLEKVVLVVGLRVLAAELLVERRHRLDVPVALPPEADTLDVLDADPGLPETVEQRADRQAARRGLDPVEPLLLGEGHDGPVAHEGRRWVRSVAEKPEEIPHGASHPFRSPEAPGSSSTIARSSPRRSAPTSVNPHALNIRSEAAFASSTEARGVNRAPCSARRRSIASVSIALP